VTAYQTIVLGIAGLGKRRRNTTFDEKKELEKKQNEAGEKKSMCGRRRLELNLKGASIFLYRG